MLPCSYSAAGTDGDQIFSALSGTRQLVQHHTLEGVGSIAVPFNVYLVLHIASVAALQNLFAREGFRRLVTSQAAAENYLEPTGTAGTSFLHLCAILFGSVHGNKKDQI